MERPLILGGSADGSHPGVHEVVVGLLARAVPDSREVEAEGRMPRRSELDCQFAKRPVRADVLEADRRTEHDAGVPSLVGGRAVEQAEQRVFAAGECERLDHRGRSAGRSTATLPTPFNARTTPCAAAPVPVAVRPIERVAPGATLNLLSVGRNPGMAMSTA